MPGSIKSIKRKPTAKSAAKRIGRMFKRTNSEDPEMTAAMDTGSPKASFDVPRPSTSSRFSISSRMTSRDDAEATPRGSKDQSRVFASWFDPTTPKKEKGPEAIAPPPLVSNYSEPILEHVKPLEPMVPVEPTGTPQTEGFPFPAPLQTSKEQKTIDIVPEKQTEPLRQLENPNKKIEEQPAVTPIPLQANRPLPSPPVTKPAIYEPPESPILPAVSKEEPKQKPSHAPTNEPKTILEAKFEHEQENITQPKPAAETRPKAEPAEQRDILPPKKKRTLKPPALPVQVPTSSTTRVRKSSMPRPTVEDEPEPVKLVEEPKEHPRKDHKTEPRNLSSKPPQKETKAKAQLPVILEKQVPAPVVPEAIRKHAELKNSPKASATPIVPPAAKISSVSAPAPSSVPKAARFTAKHSFTPSISFQPSRIVYYPDTAPAPKIARPPITAQAPIIASRPEVVVSMLTRAAPKSAPAPSIASTPVRAHSPLTSWIMSSA
ncbi:hypothetical protein FVEN_g6235 [Fusarium venenatum]|uniref:Uncharacterized protein n=1 Tax=Fusarium venenatum TaxID=56646 RepID=A0A2L2TV18_9HYPO|nr:uncharacterized protein FVRRES_01852 [Fusarium venenatum]KAG8356005.1 hypothetical protein FVEN_g6235 [Fusarium venenatum]KAH7005000.1 hypothetical protein EDB82DRAFT_65532 [Fusarium venenatum]CEI65340.1 unnamed protein product [Fusarium venenatum]